MIIEIQECGRVTEIEVLEHVHYANLTNEPGDSERSGITQKAFTESLYYSVGTPENLRVRDVLVLSENVLITGDFPVGFNFKVLAENELTVEFGNSEDPENPRVFSLQSGEFCEFILLTEWICINNKTKEAL